MKRWMKIGLAIVGLVVVAVVAIIMLVDANTFRPVLESRLSTALGRHVKVGSLSLSLLSGSLVADDLSIADDPKFGTTPFLVAKHLRIGVEMKPLIFDKQLQVRSFEAESPDIHLVRGANGSWNFSSLSQGAAPPQGQKPQDLSSLSVGLISIKDGRATVESLPAQGQPRVYEHLNMTVRNFSFLKAFPLEISASLPAGGTVNLKGNAGPISQQDAAMTAVDVQLSIKHLNPVAAGFLDASAGLAMLADVEARAVSDGVTMNSQGTIHAERLVLLKGGSPAPKAVDLSYDVRHSLKDNHGQLQDLALKTGNVAAHVTGGYDLSGVTPVVDLKMVGKALPIDELQALLPAAGVRLPNGSVLRGGTLATTLAITGPTTNSVIAGPLELDDTHLAGFNLGSKLSGIAALGGVNTGDATEIKALRMNVRVTNAGVQTDNLYASLPALGEANGSGTVASGGALDFRLTVKPTTTQGIGQVGVGLLTALNGTAGNAASGAAKNGIPMTITGTTNNPVISADVRGLVKNNASTLFGAGGQLLGGKGQSGGVVDSLTSLFGGKKK